MSQVSGGIHHVTAISGDPQKNIDFYTGVLGLRLVKQTVNFDAPQVYHFYYGDEAGHPGTLLTFFPWIFFAGKGRAGTGQLTVISFSIPSRAIGYWTDRLKQHRLIVKDHFTRFGEEVLVFHDHDGFELELVATSTDPRPPWTDGPVPPEHALRGLHGVTLSLEGYERTAELITGTLGFNKVEETENRFRYSSGESRPGTFVDLLCQPNNLRGRMGVGAVHHVAWRSQDEDAQLQLRQKLVGLGYNVSPVMDRCYFRSIYFREPGHVLFEAATDGPGFVLDEEKEKLGMRLMLPPWLEQDRNSIEDALPKLKIPRKNNPKRRS